MLLTLTIVYNIIVLSHVFVHQPWFRSDLANRLVSLFNSATILQSVQAYELTHVRNHHRFNNDRKGTDGQTLDRSSTFRLGRDGQHASLIRYSLSGGVKSLLDLVRVLLSVQRLFAVGRQETALLELVSRRPDRRRRELRQIQLDRLALAGWIVLLAVVSWRWVLLCYLPATFLALVLVNVQNYYRHYGADPDSLYANSVSHYGRLYNLLAFNDGYHQEHHLRPPTHWRQLPLVRERYRAELEQAGLVVSPVPAIVGFLDPGRRS